ncbi:MAG: extracellular solute-binding protein [Lachnospiraceae bacterium]|nr:extracellular solute-binding protein [Lachnospiraceae bacterium]
MKKKVCGILFLAIGVLSSCGSEKSPLNPDDPVSITIWHYYNGTQQAAFDTLIEEFNNTVGNKNGIYVQSYSQGSVSDLEAAVRDSINEKVGASEMPDVFSAYSDTAFEFEQKGALANLSEYLNEGTLDRYVTSYIDEGCIAADGSLRIFPVAKSTEVMMINKTDWEPFAEATGASLEKLNTIEGVVDTAAAYYEWTDSLTPDVANDGKAFYGRDAMANYFIIGLKQLGLEIFEADKGQVTFNLSEDSIRRIWDNYYVPMVKGYFGAYGSFRSDDVKTGELIAYTGSTTSAIYFPSRVEDENGSYDIEYMIMAAPVFEGGEQYAVQQGAGMVVTKSDKKHEYAAVEFLKWFTEPENNLRFSCVSGYMPVLKAANTTEVLDKMISEQNIEVADKTYDCITYVFDNMKGGNYYTNKSFHNGSAARKVLEYHLFDKAAADREAVVQALSERMSLEEATAPYTTEEAFKEWYADFCDALNDTMGQ